MIRRADRLPDAPKPLEALAPLPALRERPRRRPRPARLAAYAFLAGASLASLFPLYWMFVVASNDTAAVNRVPPALAPGPNFLDHAGRVFDTVPFGQALLNSAIVSTTVAASVVFFSCLAGFAFAKLRFRGRNALFLLVLATMMVPVQLGIIPQFMIITRLGWVNDLKAVIVPGMVTAFGVFWMRQYISTAVPNELLDAARVDGCTTFGLFRHVVAPAARPAAAVLGVFAFMTTWNDFFWPLVVLRDPEVFTSQVALQQLNDAYYQDYGMVMAGTVLATLPLVVVFVVLGRQIIGGLLDGAVKG